MLDGKAVVAREGENVAALLARLGLLFSPGGPTTGVVWCCMGACLACAVRVQGRGTVQACLTRVHEGMRIFSGPPPNA